MATIAEPIRQRPNVASANIQLPGVESYEQVDREIAGFDDKCELAGGQL